jgi:hypothetical protein
MLYFFAHRAVFVAKRHPKRAKKRAADPLWNRQPRSGFLACVEDRSPSADVPYFRVNNCLYVSVDADIALAARIASEELA